MPATKRKTAVVDKAPATKEEAVGGEEVSSGDDSNVVRTLNVEACKSWLVSLRLPFFIPFFAHVFFEHYCCWDRIYCIRIEHKCAFTDHNNKKLKPIANIFLSDIDGIYSKNLSELQWHVILILINHLYLPLEPYLEPALNSLRKHWRRVIAQSLWLSMQRK